MLQWQHCLLDGQAVQLIERGDAGGHVFEGLEARACSPAAPIAVR
jgi:hypothetical protein